MIPLDLSTLHMLDDGHRAELHESFVRPVGPAVLRPAIGRLLIRFGGLLGGQAQAARPAPRLHGSWT